MPFDDIPRPNQEFTVEWLDDELLLYHPGETTTVYMNQTAAIVWKLCDGKRTVAEIIEMLSESFPEAGGDLGQDVQEVLDNFSQHGAIAI